MPREWLLEKQHKFVENMAKPGMTQSLAATDAGYSRAGVEANRLLQQRHIIDAIESRKRLAANFCNVTPEQIIGATALRAFATIDDAFDDDGNFDIKKARRTGAIHLIKKLERTQVGFKVEFYSNESAQEKLGNYLGLDKAPESSNDIASLKLAIEEVALHLAGDEPVSSHHRREAWRQVSAWAQEKRAKYSQHALQELNKEFQGEIIDAEVNEIRENELGAITTSYGDQEDPAT